MLTLLLLLLGLIFSDSWASSVSVSPPHFEISKPAGQAIQDSIKIFNTSPDKMNIRLYVGDFWYDKEGKRNFPPPKSTPFSAANWISFPKTEIELPPHSTIDAPFIFSIPADSPPSAFVAIFVERVGRNLAGKDDKTHGNVAISLRVAVPVLFSRPDKEIRNVNIVKFSVKKPNSYQPLVLRFHLRNSDDTFFFPEGNILVVDEQSKEAIAKSEIRRDKVILPGQSLKYELPLSFSPHKGKYQGLLTLYYGKEKSLVQNFNFTLP